VEKTVPPAEAVVEKGPLGSGDVVGFLDKKSITDVLAMEAGEGGMEPAAASAARKALWSRYAREQRDNPVRREEHESRALRFGDAVMRYEYRVVGEKPAKGFPLYIALHGGGGGPAQMNDAQWRHMQVYYLNCVTNGVYVAPRGVSNTWNLHFVGASYPLYDRLIENMVLFKGVDPNRVYLLGYSAGGDGVYQITPRMADRFAAANMSAGHHNGTSPRSLYNVPFLVQVGELDKAYKRHYATVGFAEKLKALQTTNPDGYIHDIFVHAGRPHNFLDNDPKEREQRIITNPSEWKSGGAASVENRNTSAVAWLRQHRRRYRPERVAWDLKTRASSRTGKPKDGSALWTTEARYGQFYWLDVGERGHEELGTSEVVASFDKEANTITIETCGNYLRVLVDGAMADLSKPVTVKVGDVSKALTLHPNLKTMARTLVDRGDPYLMFEAAIVIEQKDGGWDVREG